MESWNCLLKKALKIVFDDGEKIAIRICTITQYNDTHLFIRNRVKNTEEALSIARIIRIEIQNEEGENHV